ncbi:D-beta-hydroxybutyrate dehydrogenase [Roseivivax jejudonensis]|uniref:D-beta-hydroxybutyrate dehydrogenase n=1 Tax=Roseivivax jejudonensis TaxID=1529041 RepID=A0A1X7A6I0_9RHOB|nr:SDR family NAD(P)-dependent oxidoreductase [Roseivivax jejudonensis]SLN70059.1 D-beta-hydroxybutyrate dehydrogenase [Roseivivax jejudonensis]
MARTRTILITGCSTGIGYDCAHALAARGWRVFASARKSEDIARLRSEGLECLHLDYEDPQSIAGAVAAVSEATGGQLDALFNNGAAAIPAPLEDVPTDAMRAAFEANFFGWHDLTRRVLPLMRAAGGGRILNNSSILGLVAAKYRGAYVATKFALEGWSDTLRMELDGTGIEVVLIEPGPIATEFRANAVRQFERWIDWENSPNADAYRASLLDQLYKGSGRNWPVGEATRVAVRALEARRPKARYTVTPPAHIGAFAARVLPTRWLDRLLSKS